MSFSQGKKDAPVASLLAHNFTTQPPPSPLCQRTRRGDRWRVRGGASLRSLKPSQVYRSFFATLFLKRTLPRFALLVACPNNTVPCSLLNKLPHNVPFFSQNVNVPSNPARHLVTFSFSKKRKGDVFGLQRNQPRTFASKKNRTQKCTSSCPNNTVLCSPQLLTYPRKGKGERGREEGLKQPNLGGLPPPPPRAVLHAPKPSQTVSDAHVVRMMCYARERDVQTGNDGQDEKHDSPREIPTVSWVSHMETTQVLCQCALSLEERWVENVRPHTTWKCQKPKVVVEFIAAKFRNQAIILVGVPENSGHNMIRASIAILWLDLKRPTYGSRTSISCPEVG